MSDDLDEVNETPPIIMSFKRLYCEVMEGNTHTHTQRERERDRETEREDRVLVVVRGRRRIHVCMRSGRGRSQC